MDGATLRRILTPFERNALVLWARYRRNVKDVAGALSTGESINMDGELRRGGKAGPTVEEIQAAIESAQQKIRRHQERMMEAASKTNGEGAEILDGDEAAERIREQDGEPERLLDRADAPRIRAKDPQAAKANAEAGLGRRRGPVRRPGQAAWEVVEYLREHGPASSMEVRTAVGIHNTAMPELVQRLVDHEAIERTGKFVKRSPVLRLGPRADDVQPPKGSEQSSQGSTEPGAGTGAGQDGATPRDTPAAPSAIADPPDDAAAAGGSEQPAAAALREAAEAGYLNALLDRIRSVENCEEHVFDRLERLLAE